jgi:protocatechuate 3,4-dioxygenase beta subunit
MKTKISGLIIAVVLFVICGQSPANESQKLPVEGQVLDYIAKPVEGAEVAVYEHIYRNGEQFPYLIAPTITTDRQGHFALEADVSTQRSTFIVARKEGLALAWDGLNYSSNSKGKGHFLLVLEKAYTVTGIVVDHNGTAVSGAEVQALPVTSYMSRLRQRPILAPKEWFTTQTNSQGKFQFDQFSADVSCDFWVKAPRWGSTYKFTTYYNQSSCGFEVWRSDIRLVLPREGNIKGHVVEMGTDKPIGSVELIIQAERDRLDVSNRYCVRTITVDADGVFECNGLADGKHKIELVESEHEMAPWIVKPVEVNVVPNQTTDDVKICLEKGELIECTVREYDNERPLAGMRVSAYSKLCSTMLRTNETGTARLRVLPGEYETYASGEGYLPWRMNEPVIVKAGETTHLDILLEKSPILKGSIVEANGQPAKNVLVIAHPFGDRVYTDGEGKFVAGYDEKRTGQGLFVMARDVEHSLAALVRTKEFGKPVELTLSPALTVKGKITDPNGLGIPAARVSLCFRFASCLSQMGAEVLTDSQGNFTFNAIPPVSSDFNYVMSAHAGGFGPKEYDRITIGGHPGATSEIPVIQLVPANVSISGTVVDANDLPAGRVPVFLHGADGFDQPRKTTATNEDGRFEIRRVCKGPLRIQANFPSNPGGAGFLYAQGGGKDVKIILGQERVHQPHVSLIGKPLPDLKDIGIELSPADTKGKIILVCFWDMQQRPSRHCMNQIVKQAAPLKQKEVIVIAVQASEIDEGKLKQWAKKNNVPFPVGMIPGDAEKTRFAWGVKSLPWLILTDKQHLVVDSGFGLDELNDKIKAAR